MLLRFINLSSYRLCIDVKMSTKSLHYILIPNYILALSYAGDIGEAITRDFGSFDNMSDKLSAACIGIQGSGWGWLAYSKSIGSLTIATCANQDPLEPTTGKQYRY